MAKNKWMILLAVVLLLAVVPTARAAEFGSLRIHGIEGSVALYCVESADGTLEADFEDVPSNILNKTNVASKAKALWKYTRDEELMGQTLQADEEGSALYSPLEQGLYLVGSTARTPKFDPFLVQIPTQIGGRQVFHIEAEPKQEDPDPSTPTKPTEPNSSNSSQNIPQTGTSVIPKYLLMGFGVLITLVGLYQMIRGKEESYE